MTEEKISTVWVSELSSEILGLAILDENSALYGKFRVLKAKNLK